jgi:hypothetical protein
MRQDEPEADPDDLDYRAHHKARIPGFNAQTEVGLGDVIKRATTVVGIHPCAPCNKRAAALNNWLVFTGRR